MTTNEILLEILTQIKSLSCYCCAPEPQHTEKMKEIHIRCSELREEIWKDQKNVK